MAVTTAWQQFTTTFAMPAASTITPGTNGDGSIQAVLQLPLNTTMIVTIAGVQLELDAGAVTAFEARPPSVEMALCQRYYQVGGTSLQAYQTAGGPIATTAPFPVQFRTAPTMVPTWNNTNITSPAIAGVADHLALTGSPTATGPFALTALWTASAEL
jgi:hypothetical protein